MKQLTQNVLSVIEAAHWTRPRVESTATNDADSRFTQQLDEFARRTDWTVKCPRFSRCSAPICPIDPLVMERTHLKGESACYYLRLYAKNRLSGRKSGAAPVEIIIRVDQLYQKLMGRYAPLKKALERASSSPPKTLTARKSDDEQK